MRRTGRARRGGRSVRTHSPFLSWNHESLTERYSEEVGQVPGEGEEGGGRTEEGGGGDAAGPDARRHPSWSEDSWLLLCSAAGKRDPRTAARPFVNRYGGSGWIRYSIRRQESPEVCSEVEVWTSETRILSRSHLKRSCFSVHCLSSAAAQDLKKLLSIEESSTEINDS